MDSIRPDLEDLEVIARGMRSRLSAPCFAPVTPVPCSQVHSSSLPVSGAASITHRASVRLHKLMTAGVPREILGYLVLAAQRVMRDMKLPAADSYWDRTKGVYRRTLVVEDTF